MIFVRVSVLLCCLGMTIVYASESIMMNNPPIEAIQKVIESIPEQQIRLCKLTNSGEIEDEVALTRPTSDHDLLVQLNRHGVFATWNILNPTSPVAPGFLPEGKHGMYRLYFEEERQAHLEAIAKTMIDLFALDVDAVVLQEVPDISSHYFWDLIRYLNQYGVAKGVEIDFNTLIYSYHPTQKTIAHDYHQFGNALLVKHNGNIIHHQQSQTFNGRVTKYKLYSRLSNQYFQMLNVHGDYAHSEELSHLMADFIRQQDSIILGDTNIPLVEKGALQRLSTLPGSCVQPSTTSPSTAEKSITLDCIVGNVSNAKTMVKGELYNYAAGDN